MRSLLFAPADSQRKVDKALASSADVIILDLEDSVSLENKTAARRVAAEALGKPRKSGQLVYVRVNPLDSGLTEDDLHQILPAKPDGIMQPKTNSADDVDTLRQLLGCNIPIIAISTETAASLFNLGSYAALSPPLAGLTWGAEDLSNALGAATSRNADDELTGPYQLARTLCLAGARAAAIEPIDTVCVDFTNPDALELECMHAARDGFTAKMAIHPNQIEIINRVFTPSADELEQANLVVQAFADAGNPGVLAIDGVMYDRPHLERAKQLAARAQRYKKS